MLIRSFENITPKIHPTVHLAETAAVIGDVALEENVTIWYGAVLRGDAQALHEEIGPPLDEHVAHVKHDVPNHRSLPHF